MYMNTLPAGARYRCLASAWFCTASTLTAQLLTAAHKSSVTAALPLALDRNDKSPASSTFVGAHGAIAWRNRWDLNRKLGPLFQSEYLETLDNSTVFDE